jgi:pantoate--beta-alanine ligase
VEVVRAPAAWRALTEDARARGQRVGLVPTMGALHAGHASLIAAARRECDFVVVTIFVNPRQFSDNADLGAYPRTPAEDHAVCEENGSDLVVEPALADIWPQSPRPTATTVSVAGVSERWEGAGRPGHFDGVASVVAKLMIINGPGAAYFGEKDFQQLVVVRQMVLDLSLDVAVVGCPIVRDADGLALSSRNQRLSDDGRRDALALSRAVSTVGAAPVTVTTARATLANSLATSAIDVAYAEIVDPVTLNPLHNVCVGEGRVLVAGVVDGVRLLDNGPVQLIAEESAHAARA